MTMISDRQDPQTELALKARYDSEALAELIVDCTGSVWSTIHRKMQGRSEEDKEDMYQIIMLSLCRGIGSFKGKSSFFVWFWGLQANKIAGYYRKDIRNRVFLMTDPDEEIRTDEVTEPEWYNVYDEYKELLPERHYHHLDIVYSIAVDGYTLSEVAEEHGKYYEAMRSMWRNGKAFLKEDLEKQGITYSKGVSNG